MNYITELQKFIASQDNWRETLEQKPYCLKIKEKGNLILFKYNQIESDFSLKIVQESRGIILEKDTWKIVCLPFFKFFNHSEPNCADVDFSTARIQEKIDGSIIKLYYYDGMWNIATNGTINAFGCELPNVAIYGKDTPKTFGELFTLVVELNTYSEIKNALEGQKSCLDKGKTYIFEVISHYNKVVINYPHPDIFHIGTRDTATGKESIEDIGVPHPKEYTFNSIEDVILNAKELPHDQEGYVVVDTNWARCKVKGIQYLSLHRLKGEGTPTPKRLLELVRINEGEELLTYFPEFEDGYKELEDLYEKFIEKVESDLDYLFSMEYNDRKAFAKEALRTTYPPFAFQVLDHRWSMGDFGEFCKEMPIDSLLKCVKED